MRLMQTTDTELLQILMIVLIVLISYDIWLRTRSSNKSEEQPQSNHLQTNYISKSWFTTSMIFPIYEMKIKISKIFKTRR